jgi:hypothetical protein
MEQRKEVKPIQVDFKCPVCFDGYLRPTGMVLTSNPPKYPHKCNGKSCGADCYYTETFSGKTYPYIDYVEADNFV